MVKGKEMNKVNICCETCEFYMPDNKGNMVCAGHKDHYGEIAPILGVDYEKECWSISFDAWCEEQNCK